MAIYKNREVTLNNPTRTVTLPSTISVRHKDGTHETVPLSQVSFTQPEKDSLVKANASIYNDVTVASDEDVKAVKLGVTPPSDPILKEQAKAKVQHQRQAEETQKRTDEAKKQAEKDLDKKVDHAAPATLVAHPQTPWTKQ